MYHPGMLDDFDDRQIAFLLEMGTKLKSLIKSVDDGSFQADIILGEKRLSDGRIAKITLSVQRTQGDAPTKTAQGN